MPFHDKVALPQGQSTRITDTAVTAVRVQNNSSFDVLLQATVGVGPAVSFDGGITLGPGEILPSNYTLADLFPGVPGADHVSATCVLAVSVSVSHA